MKETYLNPWYNETKTIHTDRDTTIRISLINANTGEIRQVDLSYKEINKKWEEEENNPDGLEAEE